MHTFKRKRILNVKTSLTCCKWYGKWSICAKCPLLTPSGLIWMSNFVSAWNNLQSCSPSSVWDRPHARRECGQKISKTFASKIFCILTQWKHSWLKTDHEPGFDVYIYDSIKFNSVSRLYLSWHQPPYNKDYSIFPLHYLPLKSWLLNTLLISPLSCDNR